VSGGEFTAKDFRTWHATVLAAGRPGRVRGRRHGSRAAPGESRGSARRWASYLGNTPAVARASYIDPRVITCMRRAERFAASLAGLGKENEFGDLATAGHAERAVLKLLATTPAPGE